MYADYLKIRSSERRGGDACDSLVADFKARMSMAFDVGKVADCPSREEKRAGRFRTGRAKNRQRTLAGPKDVAADEGRSKGPISAECKHRFFKF